VELVQLGSSDLRVSRVGLGCNNFGMRIDLEATRAVVDAALETGINFLDTADVYGDKGGSERFLGEVLKGRRDAVVLATKFGNDMGTGDEARGSRDYIRRAIAGSLERLQIDQIDLYYLHKPDPVTPIAETLGALDELAREGSIRYAAGSNFSAEQLDEAAAVARENGFAGFVALQNEYSLLKPEAEEDALPRCREYGIGFVPYFPLASGLLTGKYRRGEAPPEGGRLTAWGKLPSDEEFAEVEELEQFAKERGHTLLELAIAALASQPGVASVIAGATSPEQVRANAAAGEWRLTAEELEALARLRPERTGRVA
jgi:aryl-alcohol dehydrogenase-like predicted oxidoreductase